MFKNSKVLIVGDAMLDRYVIGGVSRISPEAPVPVLKVERETAVLGGASNVAANAASLGGQCVLLGSAGQDEHRKVLERLLEEAGARASLFDFGISTTAKTRIVAGRQQIARVDHEELIEPDNPAFEELDKALSVEIPKAGAVVISDYGKGIIAPKFCERLIKQAKIQGKFVVVDPKGADWTKYRGASLITPNVNELSEAAGKKVKNTDEDITAHGRLLREKYSLDFLVVTRSEKGITVIGKDEEAHFPTEAREVFDVSGAGDTVVAALALALSAGLDIKSAARLANTAAGVAVSHAGTCAVTFAELERALFAASPTKEKLKTREGAAELVRQFQKAGKSVVFTNGCFDILHRGHAEYLSQARKLGDMLIVGLNSDASVKALKGEKRPVNKAQDRAFMLSSLSFVDAVVVFEEDTPRELLSELKPDILVKGGDYKEEEIAGREFVKKTAVLPFVKGFSTTGIIERL